METAAGGQLVGGGRLAEHDLLALRLARRRGDRGEKRVRVGVLRAREERVARPRLDDAAEVHDRDRVRHVPDDREVVRDEEIRQVEPVLKAAQEVEDLCLDRDVDRRHGLVEDDQLRIESESACDADTLALPAGELARIGARMLGAQSHELEQLRHPRAPLLSRALTLVDDERERDDLLDRLPLVQRRVRILEDDLHLSAQPPEPAGGDAEEVGRIEVDAPEVGSSRRSSSRASVDLPKPDSPTARPSRPG